MPRSRHQNKCEGTLFQCHAPEAKQVFLVGTFNEWDPTATPMERCRDGTWRTRVELPAGRYEYKFVVDDCWCCEPGADDTPLTDCVPNPFGTMNRVIDVSDEFTAATQYVLGGAVLAGAGA